MKIVTVFDGSKDHKIAKLYKILAAPLLILRQS